MKEDEIEIAVQINGKVKGKITIPADADKDAALEDKYPENIVKEIYVPGRIVNIVAK